MTVKAVLDRGFTKVLSALLAKERREPIHIRLVSPHLGDFEMNGKSLVEKLTVLRTRKNASVLLLLDRKEHKNYIKQHGELPEKLRVLQDLGVRIQTVRNLHAKIVMVENKIEKCLLVSSANLTDTAYNKNHEAGVYIQNEHEEVYDSFRKYIIGILISINP